MMLEGAVSPDVTAAPFPFSTRTAMNRLTRNRAITKPSHRDTIIDSEAVEVFIEPEVIVKNKKETKEDAPTD
jgi:hypothetical protein